MIKYFIVSNEISSDILNSLKVYEVPIVKTLSLNIKDRAVSAHPDLQIHQIDPGKVVVEKSLVDYYKTQLKGIRCISSKCSVGDRYPHNIGLNVFRYKNYVVHNFKYTDEAIINYYKNKNYNFINVKQGYTKCSIAQVKDNIITSDANIYLKLKNYFNTLLIDHKQIVLKGYDYGFFGGATGSIDDNLLLSGSLEDHSSKNSIEKFAKDLNFNIIYLSDKEIEDFGSIIAIY